MRKVGKIFSIILAVMLIITMTASTKVFATAAKFNADTILNNVEQQGTPETDKITTFGGTLMKTLQTIGVVVGVIVLVILGIKYMMGSAEEKAEYKKTFIPYIIGAMLVIGASAFAGMIFNFASGFGG